MEAGVSLYDDITPVIIIYEQNLLLVVSKDPHISLYPFYYLFYFSLFSKTIVDKMW